MSALTLGLLLIGGLLWMGVMDFGRIAWEGLRLQTAADTAAQTASLVRARGLNRLGAVNWLLGVPSGIDAPDAIAGPLLKHPAAQAAVMVPPALLSIQIQLKLLELTLPRGGYRLPPPPRVPSGMGFPSFCWWPAPVESSPAYFGKTDRWARYQRAYLETLIKDQEDILKSYGGGWAAIWAERAAKACGAEGVTALDPFRLRLRRNSGDVSIWSSAWAGQGRKKTVIPFPPVLRLSGRFRGKRWLEQEPDFHRKRQRFVAWKGSEKLQLLLPKFLNLPAFRLAAVSAARPYNAIGPMFPSSGRGLGVFAFSKAFPFEIRRTGWRAQRTKQERPS